MTADRHSEPSAAVEHATNTDQADYWNGEAARHWLAYQQRYDEMGRPFTVRLMDAIRVAAPQAVLDVGCGCGATTLAAGRLVGVEGSVLGIDLSASLIGRARERAAAMDQWWVRFESGDAQHHPFEPEGFDAAISRFGLMFFSDPVAGFANILRALRRGGHLAFVCWQGALSNEWITVLGAVLRSYVGRWTSGLPMRPVPTPSPISTVSSASSPQPDSRT